MKCILLALVFMLPSYSFAQEDVDAYKIALKGQLSEKDQESTLLKIIEYYTQSGRLDRDSIRKYNNDLLELLDQKPLTINKASAKAYQLLADYRMPYTQYAPLAQELINDYTELGLFEGVLKEHYYLCSKAQRADLPESTSMYREGIQMTEDFAEDLSQEIVCRYKVRFMSSLASNLGHLKLHEQGIQQA